VDVETQETEKGTEIKVRTSKEIVLVVKGPETERIYLPGSAGSDSSYYVEKTEALEKTTEGYGVVHTGSIEKIEVLS